jgi:hypothetical protein
MIRQDHLVISQAEDLGRLIAARGQIRSVELAVAGVDPVDRERVQARLAALTGACGCTEGAIGLLASLPVAVLVYPTLGLGQSLAVVVAAALLGKGFGLLRAWWVLRVEIARVRSRVFENS